MILTRRYGRKDKTPVSLPSSKMPLAVVAGMYGIGLYAAAHIPRAQQSIEAHCKSPLGVFIKRGFSLLNTFSHQSSCLFLFSCRHLNPPPHNTFLSNNFWGHYYDSSVCCSHRSFCRANPCIPLWNISKPFLNILYPSSREEILTSHLPPPHTHKKEFYSQGRSVLKHWEGTHGLKNSKKGKGQGGSIFLDAQFSFGELQ